MISYRLLDKYGGTFRSYWTIIPVMPHREREIRVLYEDNHLLALFKPAGMLVQGDRTEDPSLLDWAKAWIGKRYAKPGRVFIGLVHRLDRPVPGVVLFARTSKAASRLSAQFRSRSVKKVYWAVAHGHLRPADGIARNYISRKQGRAALTLPDDPSGRYAELRYKTIDRKPGASLVEITLVTGRHHQIRAQLSALGHPIVGDVKYGSPRQTPSGSIALLARRLTCRHPTKPMDMTFQAPLPEDWPWGEQ